MGTGTNASCTESALDACLPGGLNFDETVTFSCGGSTTIALANTKTISADTTIGGGVITIFGGHVFVVNAGVEFTVQNLIIANSGGLGPGPVVNNGSMTVTNSTFSGNTASGGDGGAIYNGGTLTITDSTFSVNGAVFGGAI